MFFPKDSLLFLSEYFFSENLLFFPSDLVFQFPGNYSFCPRINLYLLRNYSFFPRVNFFLAEN
jgi:hypothetical protein